MGLVRVLSTRNGGLVLEVLIAHGNHILTSFEAALDATISELIHSMLTVSCLKQVLRLHRMSFLAKFSIQFHPSKLMADMHLRRCHSSVSSADGIV